MLLIIIYAHSFKTIILNMLHSLTRFIGLALKVFSSHSSVDKVVVILFLLIDSIFYFPWFFFPFPLFKWKLILIIEVLTMVFNEKWQWIEILSCLTNQCRCVHDWSSYCNQHRFLTKHQLCHNLFGTRNCISFF